MGTSEGRLPGCVLNAGGGNVVANLCCAASLSGMGLIPSFSAAAVLRGGRSSVSKASSSDASDRLLLLCARLLAAAFSARLSLACAAATCAFASSCWATKTCASGVIGKLEAGAIGEIIVCMALMCPVMLSMSPVSPESLITCIIRAMAPASQEKCEVKVERIKEKACPDSKREICVDQRQKARSRCSVLLGALKPLPTDQR